MNTYWMVHAQNKHGIPKARHNSYSSAANEATRLASLFPGTVFSVLQAIEGYHVPAMVPAKTIYEVKE